MRTEATVGRYAGPTPTSHCSATSPSAPSVRAAAPRSCSACTTPIRTSDLPPPDRAPIPRAPGRRVLRPRASSAEPGAAHFPGPKYPGTVTAPDLSSRPDRATEPPAPGGLPERRVLRDEVLLVLFLSLAASALYALVNLLTAPIRGVAAPLYSRGALAYQLLDIGTSLVPVALVAHLLRRSRESLASIGLDARRPLADLALGVVLAVAVGAVGVAIYAASVQLGVNRSVVPVPPTGHWWTVPVLLLGALRSGLYQRAGRTTALVVAHFLLDAGAGLGYLALRGHVPWLPIPR